MKQAVIGPMKMSIGCRVMSNAQLSFIHSVSFCSIAVVACACKYGEEYVFSVLHSV